MWSELKGFFYLILTNHPLTFWKCINRRVKRRQSIFFKAWIKTQAQPWHILPRQVNQVMATLHFGFFSSTVPSNKQQHLNVSFLLTYFRVLNVLEVHIVDRENLVSLLEPSSVGIWVGDYLQQHTRRKSETWGLFFWTKIIWGCQCFSHPNLGDEDPQLGSLPSTDIEAQLCSWRLLQHNSTR